MTENISAWITVCLALERFVTMRYWSFARQYCHRRNTKRLIIAISVVSAILNLPYFMIHRIELRTPSNGTTKAITKTTALRRSQFYTVYSWFRMVTVQIIPLVTLCILNVLLITIVYQHSMKLHKNSQMERSITTITLGGEAIISEVAFLADSSSNVVRNIPQWLHNAHQKKRNAQRKLNILLIAVILLFLFGAIPQAFSYIRIFEAFGICELEFHYCPIYVLYRMVTTSIALISYGLTFFLYLFLNRHFRKELSKCRG